MNEITIKVPPISEPAICRSCGRVFQLGDPRQQKIDRIAAQRDKLAWLLREVMPDYAAPQGKGHLYAEIEAALAEVENR